MFAVDAVVRETVEQFNRKIFSLWIHNRSSSCSSRSTAFIYIFQLFFTLFIFLVFFLICHCFFGLDRLLWLFFWFFKLFDFTNKILPSLTLLVVAQIFQQSQLILGGFTIAFFTFLYFQGEMFACLVVTCQPDCWKVAPPQFLYYCVSAIIETLSEVDWMVTILLIVFKVFCLRNTLVIIV